MKELKIKPPADCRWDLISLGEVLLRFDSGDKRIHNARTFRVWDGGGEYNVARGLSKTFRQETAIVTALADNALGRLAEDLICQGGVDSSQILWRAADGRGANTRNGVYYIERGFGQRAPASCFDRANTAISQLKTSEIEWQKIFGENGARWFHTGGIFAGLSDTTWETARAAMQIARENGTVVSFDLNYRDSLWRDKGGREAANEINDRLLPFADVVFGAPDFDANFARYDAKSFETAAVALVTKFPNLKMVVSTLRTVKSASLHDFSAVCFANDKIVKARSYQDVDVFDRVGSGDAFAAGFIYGLLTEQNAPQFAIDCGTAHAVLSLTTPGDNSMATLSEVVGLMKGEGAQAKR